MYTTAQMFEFITWLNSSYRVVDYSNDYYYTNDDRGGTHWDLKQLLEIYLNENS